MDTIGAGLASAWQSFKKRGYVFEHENWQHQVWDWLLMIPTCYTAVFLPTSLVFPSIIWEGSLLADAALDTLFFIDVNIKLRTSYTERGHHVLEPAKVRSHYLHSWSSAEGFEPCCWAVGVGSGAWAGDVGGGSVWRPHRTIRAGSCQT